MCRTRATTRQPEGCPSGPPRRLSRPQVPSTRTADACASDYLEGGEGADYLQGGAGADVADGKGGTDQCEAAYKKNCESGIRLDPETNPAPQSENLRIRPPRS
ncbi:hypothetical protein [Streptomyces venezuelae]|uniref:hypothetical protein n=1 Tax=Streptomyces venezuelae TaxID=54571 RepID=UPI00331F7193